MSFKIIHTKLFKVLVVAVVSLFLIFLNPYNFFNPVRSALFLIFSPVQKIAYGTAFEASAIKNFLFSIGDLKKENEKLIKENRDLLAQKASLEETGKENEALRQDLNLLPRTKFDLEGANVISQNPSGQGDWIEINKGKGSGMEKDMPVIVNSGILVGKIGEVFANSSKVILLNNPESAVNAVDLKTDSRGVVQGEYGMGIILDMVLQSEALNKGDEVLTSGIGNVPKGLFIGNISETSLSRGGLFQGAIVSSPIDFSRLDFVFVIKGNI